MSASWNSASCTRNKQFLRGSLYKKGVLESFSKFTDKHKNSHPGVFCQKICLKNLANRKTSLLFFNKVADWKPETARSSHWRCSVK